MDTCVFLYKYHHKCNLPLCLQSTKLPCQTAWHFHPSHRCSSAGHAGRRNTTLGFNFYYFHGHQISLRERQDVPGPCLLLFQK